MSQPTGECCYVPLNSYEEVFINNNNNDTNDTIVDFDDQDDNVDKLLKTYCKDSYWAKIIFSFFLMNPLLRIICTGII